LEPDLTHAEQRRASATVPGSYYATQQREQALTIWTAEALSAQAAGELPASTIP
jgi:hypothetical protein